MQFYETLNAVANFIIPVVVFFIPCIFILIFAKKKKAWIAGYVFTLVFLLRVFVSFFGSIETDSGLETSGLSALEKIIDSILHTLQTFSLDEDYTGYILEGKQILRSLGLERLSEMYGNLGYVLNIAAPLTGGALLLDILTNVFPKLNIWLHPFREKYVFSELNEMSICLAEDIISKKSKKSGKKDTYTNRSGLPFIIFADTYADEEEESSSDLMCRAKKIKAVCVKQEISDLFLRQSRSVRYLMTSTDFQSNISSFSGLMENGNNRPKASEKMTRFTLTVSLGGVFEIDRGKFGSNVKFKTDPAPTSDTAGGSSGNTLGADEYKLTDITSDSFTTTLTYEIKLKKRYIHAADSIKISITNFDELLTAQGFDRNSVEYSVKLPDPPTYIFMFVQDEYQAKIAEKIYRNRPEESYKVVLRIIKDYKNTAVNLMREVPLFLPLLYNNSRSLHITILGGGKIAQEVFKAVYWCSQMNDTRVSVSVLSDNIEEFVSEINISCPELIKSCVKSTDEQPNEMLKIFPDDGSKGYSAPYLDELNFAQVSDVRNISDYPENVLRLTDYYVVALGSDEKAIDTTSILSLALKKARLSGGCPESTIIAPAVFDPDMADSITVRKRDEKTDGPFIVPFALFNKRYSYDNVFMSESESDAKANAELYNRSKQLNQQNDEYSYWANIARVIHAPYKLFGLGLLKLTDIGRENITEDPFELFEVVFDGDTEKTISELRSKAQTEYAEAHSENAVTPADKLAWLEHRRWTAFIRAQGFSCPSKKEFESYFPKLGSHKNLDLKLHPCIVETSMGKMPHLVISSGYDPADYDSLDSAAIMVYLAKKKITAADLSQTEIPSYKVYDYPIHDKALLKLLIRPDAAENSRQ